MNTVVFPGSFDPITYGHLDIIIRLIDTFDQLHIVISDNPNKKQVFTFEDRLTMVAKSLEEKGIIYKILNSSNMNNTDNNSNKEILKPKVLISYNPDLLLVDYCVRIGVKTIVKGIRNSEDLNYEISMAHMNRELKNIDTVFMVARSEYSYVSSSLIKQVARLGGDVDKYLPNIVCEFIKHYDL